jgi:hypothetical protein
MEVIHETLAAKFQAILPHLDERQRRRLLGGRPVHWARRDPGGGPGCQVPEAKVSLGVDELEAGTEPLGRARRPGGRPKRATDLDPSLRPTPLALLPRADNKRPHDAVGDIRG